MEMNASLDSALNGVKIIAQQGLAQLLEENKKKWQAELQDKQRPLLQKINPNYVRLNVGGTKFITTLDTLTKIKNTKLEMLITGKAPLAFDHKGRVFIDRNGQYFGYVLDCLRDEKIDYPKDQALGKRIQRELEYFGLLDNKDMKEGGKNLLGEIKASTTDGDEWRLSNGKTVSKSLTLESKETPEYAVGIKEVKSGVYEWRFIPQNTINGEQALVSFGLISQSKLGSINELGEECDYGFTNDGIIFKTGDLDEDEAWEDEDKAAEMGGTGEFASIGVGKEIILEYNAKNRTLKVQCKSIGVEHTLKMKGTAKDAYYPYFFIDLGKFVLLETKHTEA